MGCEFASIKDADGKDLGLAIICSRGRRQPLCSVGLCGKPSVALCDYPVERKGVKATCDAPMCARHRHPVPGQSDMDWCEGHWNHERRKFERGAQVTEAPMGVAGSHADPADG